MNPLRHLYDKFNSGDPDLKNQSLPAGPLMVDLEPMGLCNFRCVFCPTGLQALGRPGGIMDRETHRAILYKTQPYKSALRYIGWGEPLMHPDIAQFVADAVDDRRLTHINTNASKLTPHMAEDLVDAGLHSIKFSFQGTDRETYKMMRRTDFFEGMLDAIEMMRTARGYSQYPYIAASTSTTDETPEMVEQFRERLEPLVDELTIGKTVFEFIDMAAVPPKQKERLEEAAKASTVEKVHPVPCPEVFGKLTIHWDGSIRVCCNDFKGETNLGNIKDCALQEAWRHHTMTEYRDRLAKKEYGGPLCSVCWDYINCTKHEEAVEQ